MIVIGESISSFLMSISISSSCQQAEIQQVCKKIREFGVRGRKLTKMMIERNWRQGKNHKAKTTVSISLERSLPASFLFLSSSSRCRFFSDVTISGALSHVCNFGLVQLKAFSDFA